MPDYRFKITDRVGKFTRVIVHSSNQGAGAWESLMVGAFTYDKGVTSTGCYPSGRDYWLSLFGGDAADDKNLIFHLDGVFGPLGPQKKGKGRIYHSDHLNMAIGDATWELQ